MTAYLDAGAAVGRRIVELALWHGGRCNWIGALPVDDDGHLDVVHAALGPDLYQGTSGIAVFLGELARLTGEAEIRRTALGAMRQALSRVDDVSQEAAAGLYRGRAGVALAAARVGTATREPGLVEAAVRLAARVRPVEGQHAFDLVGGRAGAVVGLLAVRRLTGERTLLSLAEHLGDELIAIAAVDADGALSWSSDDGAELPLTGLSHGASGAALALAELHRETGEARFRTAAEQAMLYERRLFDPGAENWPDLRARPDRGFDCGPSFVTAWCHGASGIALARLRAWHILGDAACRAEALAGLRTTERFVRALLACAGGNWSLCHGITGDAEVLAEGTRCLGSSWPLGLDLAHEAARIGLERHAADHAWPCAPGAETPVLMLGLAGIGLFYLRLHDPGGVPSVLLVCPEQWVQSGLADQVHP